MSEPTQDDYEHYRHIKQRDTEFSAWRQAKADEMPQLAARVFALRGKGYMGCGFHWGLEKSLGAIINRLNDYDDPGYYNTNEAITNQLVLKVLVEGLEERVAKIEKELQS